MSIAVKKVGKMLFYASDILKDDKKLVISAVSNDGSALEYASNNLKNDKDVVSATVNSDYDYSNYRVLCFASETFKNDREIVLAAVTYNPNELCFASDTLKNDREIVYAAISKNGNQFKYASEHLRNDKELALLAISNSSEEGYQSDDYYIIEQTFKYVSETLKKDLDVIIAAVINDGFTLHYLSNEFIRLNYKVVVYAINTSGINVLSCVPYDDCTSCVPFDYCTVEKDEYSFYNMYIDCMTNHRNIYYHIQETIQSHDNFLLFLNGVCVPRSQSIIIKLRNHGPHHSIKFLKLIGEFTGFIYDNDYRIYKNVFSYVNL